MRWSVHMLAGKRCCPSHEKSRPKPISPCGYTMYLQFGAVVNIVTYHPIRLDPYVVELNNVTMLYGRVHSQLILIAIS